MDERPRPRRQRASESTPEELPWDRPEDYEAPTDTAGPAEASWDRPGDDDAPGLSPESLDGGGPPSGARRRVRAPAHAAAAGAGKATVASPSSASARSLDARPWPSDEPEAAPAAGAPAAVDADADPDDALAPVLDDVAPFVRLRAQQFLPPGQRRAFGQASSAEGDRAVEPPDLARQGVGPTPPDGLFARPTWDGYGGRPPERAVTPGRSADEAGVAAVFRVPIPHPDPGASGEGGRTEQLVLRIELAIVDDAARRAQPLEPAPTEPASRESSTGSRTAPAAPGLPMDPSWLERPVSDPLVALTAPSPGRDEPARVPPASAPTLTVAPAPVPVQVDHSQINPPPEVRVSPTPEAVAGRAGGRAARLAFWTIGIGLVVVGLALVALRMTGAL